MSCLHPSIIGRSARVTLQLRLPRVELESRRLDRSPPEPGTLRKIAFGTMASYQTTYAPPRQAPFQVDYRTSTPASAVQQRPIQESQEWVLFPSHPRSSTQTQTISTERTPRTAGLSRLSDLGSFETAARSDDEGAIDDDELDSLDDGLRAFHEPLPLYQESSHGDQTDSILPTHDGLGTFPGSSPPVQEQLWHFEQYNPRKRTVDGHHRRRSSVFRRLDAVADHEEAVMEKERVERIQKWRLEQSRALLDEVEKQTRRRLSHANQCPPAIADVTHRQAIQNTDQAGDETSKAMSPGLEANESFWQCVTRRVIRDFIGIDDALLSVILGDSLPTEMSKPSIGLTASKPIFDLSLATTSHSGWEKRLLDRLARELGIVVQQLSDHPNAFSTPAIPSTPDYAGISISPSPFRQIQAKPTPLQEPGTTSSTSPFFAPTLQQRPTSAHSESTHAALWGIEEEPSTTQPHLQTEIDYWERPPTLQTVFRFLRQRFTSPRPTPPRPTNIATATTPDSLRRAAIIRAHHPLVSRAQARRSASSGHGFGYSRRAESSCASASAKRRRSGSSRNYWDLGGSTASGSGIVAEGYGVGGWGEV